MRTCPRGLAWCRGHENSGAIEHIAADLGEIETGGGDVRCYPWVDESGSYEDKIFLVITSVDDPDNPAEASLTVDQALRLRALIDRAITNRTEVPWRRESSENGADNLIGAVIPTY